MIIVILRIKTKYDSDFSVQQMEQMERRLKDSELFTVEKLKGCRDAMELCKQLNLKVEYYDDDDSTKDSELENEGVKLEKNKEAMLTHCEDENYNGLIVLRRKLESFKFACIHEIIHYIFDVGYGEKVPVDVCYSRGETGKTIGIKEQGTNYLTAAYIMPYDEIAEEIKEYDNSKPKMDELKFLRNLELKYEQSRLAVIRRIREVRRLSSLSVLQNT